MKPVKQAVILAGGLGTRLRPLTLTSPKPMIPIHGKPFLQYIIELLKKNDIRDVVILVGYLNEKIEKYFKNGKKFGLSIRYSYSPVGADTGTRIKNALPILEKRFLLLYGDNYWPLTLRELIRFYEKKNRKSLVTVYTNKDNATKNNIYVGDDGIVERYDRHRVMDDLNGVDIGFFLLDKSIFYNLPKRNFSFEDFILPRLIKNKQLAGFLTDRKYYGLSTHERIPIIENYFKDL